MCSIIFIQSVFISVSVHQVVILLRPLSGARCIEVRCILSDNVISIDNLYSPMIVTLCLVLFCTFGVVVRPNYRGTWLVTD